jgi:hypothetical protein
MSCWYRVAQSGDGSTYKSVSTVTSNSNGANNLAYFEVSGVSGLSYSDGACSLSGYVATLGPVNMPGSVPALLFCFFEQDGTAVYSSFTGSGLSLFQQYNNTVPGGVTSGHWATLLYSTSQTNMIQPSITFTSAPAYNVFANIVVYGA